jgi:uncharacterized membrane protein YccC
MFFLKSKLFLVSAKATLVFVCTKLSIYTFPMAANRIGGVMISVLTSGVVDRGFEPRSDQTKEYEIGICCFSA